MYKYTGISCNCEFDFLNVVLTVTLSILMKESFLIMNKNETTIKNWEVISNFRIVHTIEFKGANKFQSHVTPI